MKREAAVRVIASLGECTRILNEALEFVMQECTEEEARAFRRGVGYTMSEMQDRFSDPIFREHPDLVPPDAGYTPPQGPTLSELGRRGRPRIE